MPASPRGNNGEENGTKGYCKEPVAVHLAANTKWPFWEEANATAEVGSSTVSSPVAAVQKPQGKSKQWCREMMRAKLDEKRGEAPPCTRHADHVETLQPKIRSRWNLTRLVHFGAASEIPNPSSVSAAEPESGRNGRTGRDKSSTPRCHG